MQVNMSCHTMPWSAITSSCFSTAQGRHRGFVMSWQWLNLTWLQILLAHSRPQAECTLASVVTPWRGLHSQASPATESKQNDNKQHVGGIKLQDKSSKPLHTQKCLVNRRDVGIAWQLVQASKKGSTKVGRLEIQMVRTFRELFRTKAVHNLFGFDVIPEIQGTSRSIGHCLTHWLELSCKKTMTWNDLKVKRNISGRPGLLFWSNMMVHYGKLCHPTSWYTIAHQLRKWHCSLASIIPDMCDPCRVL